MDTINSRFKLLREACDKTQEEWGKILGITKSGVSDIESGRRKVNNKHLLMLQNWGEYSVNIDWLETGKGDMFVELPELDELSEYAAELVMGKDPMIANALLAYKRLKPEYKEALQAMLEELFNIYDIKKG